MIAVGAIHIVSLEVYGDYGHHTETGMGWKDVQLIHVSTLLYALTSRLSYIISEREKETATCTCSGHFGESQKLSYN